MKTYSKSGYLGKMKINGAHIQSKSAPLNLAETAARRPTTRTQTQFRWLATHIPLLLMLLVSACTGDNSSVYYTGPLTPVSGTCDPAENSQLIKRGSNILFAPASGTLALHGRLSGNAFTATETITGADKKPFTLTLNGTLNAKSVTGTYQTNRCRYKVALSYIQP